MESRHLYAPWRMDYIKSLDKSQNEVCFLCGAAGSLENPAERKERYILWATQWSVVLMNRYPYTNGHLLVAPLEHKAELEELSQDELLDLQKQTVLAVALLKRTVSAQGMNIGINLGRCAGAGLPGHLHQHIVPRWSGDTNFMHVIGETQIVPQAMSQLYEALMKQHAQM